jgi:hypothetical protein
MCGSSVFLGVGSIVGVTLLVKVVGIRATHDLPVMPLERGLFALVCASILVGAVVYPILSFAALRGLLHQMTHARDSKSSVQEPEE